jgi:myo-inositol 2-dehydrogenase / D-chiro-inositol 1-dehydrogenase
MTAAALRAGLIGAGWIGRRHAGVLGRRDDVLVAAVCDQDEARAAGVAAGSVATVFTDWQQMLDSTALDAVWVCTPPLAHAAPAIAVLERGIALFLEKPVARSLADAGVISAAAARSAAVCAVGYQWCAAAPLPGLRAALAGKPVGCLLGQGSGGTESRPWVSRSGSGGTRRRTRSLHPGRRTRPCHAGTGPGRIRARDPRCRPGARAATRCPPRSCR